MAKRRALDQLIADLYATAPDAFVAERDALAKELRADGDAEDAARVRKLRKPNLPAGAINRAARAEPALLKKLLKAGDRLEAAQREALEGGSGDSMREAGPAHAQAVDEMLGAVAKELGSSGGSAALDKARETLRAAARDEDLRQELEAGVLVRDREAVGFGAGELIAPAPRSASSRKKGGSRKAEREVETAERALATAQERAEKAARGVELAERGLQSAEQDREEADAELDEARGRLQQAQERLDETRG